MTTCRSCGAEIKCGKTPSGKPCPFDLDGQSHFATCPQADGWRARKKEPSVPIVDSLRTVSFGNDSGVLIMSLMHDRKTVAVSLHLPGGKVLRKPPMMLDELSWMVQELRNAAAEADDDTPF